MPFLGFLLMNVLNGELTMRHLPSFKRTKKEDPQSLHCPTIVKPACIICPFVRTADRCEIQVLIF